MVGPDEVVAVRQRDAHVARVRDRRAGDADVDLGGARLAEELDDGLDGDAADDGVVDKDDPAPGDVGRERMKFKANPMAAERV